MTDAQTERLIVALEMIAANLRPQMAAQLPVYPPTHIPTSVPRWFSPGGPPFVAGGGGGSNA